MPYRSEYIATAVWHRVKILEYHHHIYSEYKYILEMRVVLPSFSPSFSPAFVICSRQTSTTEKGGGGTKTKKKALGGRGPRLSHIVKMPQTTSSKERTFICIDALDECVPEHRAKLLDSFNQILQKSPATRIFVTGRPHIRPEIGRRLAGRVTGLSISTKKDDIIKYLHSRLEEDITLNAMDSSLEAEILKKISEDVSEMYVETTLGKANSSIH